MNGRPGHIPLALLLALGASLGCTSWPCGISPTLVPTQTAGPGTGAGGELAPAQAAQLCLAAGEALEKKGFPAEAIQQYENARQHDPQVRTVARRLAVLYDLQGDATHAEAEYVRALQEQSGDADLLNDFGYFHYRHGNLEAAENWLRNAVTANSNCACAWINLGQVLARKGRNEESYQAFAHVLRPAEAYSNLGVLLAKQGRTAEARSALQQAVALDPGLAQPRAFLNALPPTPNMLPSGITHSAAPARKTPAAPIVASQPAQPSFPRLAPTPLPVPNTPPRPVVHTPTLAAITPLPPRPIATTSPSVPSPVVPAVAGDGPIIVNGPIRPTPVPANTTALRPSPFSPPPPPPPAPPPPPIAPRSAAVTDGPIIIRTSASMVQPAGAHPPTVLRMPDSLKPLKLPLTPPSTPLVHKPEEARTPAAPATPPRATLIDCEGELDPEAGPR